MFFFVILNMDQASLLGQDLLLVPWGITIHPIDPIVPWTMIGVWIDWIIVSATFGPIAHIGPDAVIFHFYHDHPQLLVMSLLWEHQGYIILQYLFYVLSSSTHNFFHLFDLFFAMMMFQFSYKLNEGKWCTFKGLWKVYHVMEDYGRLKNVMESLWKAIEYHS